MAAEITFFTVALCLYGDVSHFTWWAVISLVVSDVTCMSNITTVHTAMHYRANVMFATIATMVSLTVVVLSWMECTLFVSALADNGTLLYISGNFVLHYWPSLRLLVRVLECPHKRTITADAACLITLYNVVNNPSEVYGCTAVLPNWPFPIAAVVGSVVVEIIINAHA